MAGRDGRERYEDPSFTDGLRASYLASIELLREAGHKLEVIDASSPAEEVAAQVLGRLDTL
jgi:thymidylate kinase